MSNVNYSTSFTVDAPPQAVFDAVTNVRGWWAEDIEGNTAAAGDEFVQRYGDMHRCRIQITEAVVGQKVTWLVLENYFPLLKIRQSGLVPPSPLTSSRKTAKLRCPLPIKD